MAQNKFRTYRHVSRWLVTPLDHPAKLPQACRVVCCGQDARTATAAEDAVKQRYPQYAGIACIVEVVIPATHPAQ
jgi:hypothetical protein